jgi:hypothetical protein
MRYFNYEFRGSCSFSIIIIFIILLIILRPYTFFLHQASADSLQNAIQQRIGNYDFQVKTDPRVPIAGQNTHILLRISSVNGDDLVDLPIIIMISKDGAKLQLSQPILVPYGHYTYDYIFRQPGLYALDIDINDYSYSNQNITFTFPINVANSFTGYFYSLSYSFPLLAFIITGAAAVVAAMILIFINKGRKKKGGEEAVEEANTKS